MNVPKSYAEWVNLLVVLKEKKADVEVLEAMQQGELVWQSGVAERFVKKFIEVLNFRINSATDRFQMEMKRAGSSENLIVHALLNLRREMQFLAKLSNLNVFPEEQRNAIGTMIEEQIAIMQKSLEDSAKGERTGKLFSIVKRNRLDSIIRER